MDARPGARGNLAAAQAGTGDPLPSWREGVSKQAILDFVQRVTSEGGPHMVPPEERVAVFDNDGTLWCEKPMPIQLDFILRRLVVMADQDPALRTRQPWQAAYTRDYGWLGEVITKHYHGDDRELPVLAAGVLQAFAGITVEDFEAQADTFLRSAQHPTLGRGYLACDVCADGGAAGVSGGERVRQLHRLGWWARLHAPDQPGGVRRRP